jgi:hypothetical protein
MNQTEPMFPVPDQNGFDAIQENNDSLPNPEEISFLAPTEE